MRVPRRELVSVLAAVLVVWVGFEAAAAEATPERWADAAMPVKGGLVVWLDAARQPAAFEAGGRGQVAPNGDLDVWYDASGHRRHFAQPVRGSQPKFVAGESAAAVRFDGKDDALFYRSLGAAELGRLTLVMAVAPKSNAGGFRALFAASELGKNDYTTGLTVDQSFFASPLAFDQLNVEGRGFGGARSLMKSAAPFGQMQRVMVTVGEAGAEGVRAYVNGELSGVRPREAGVIRADYLFLGARYYSNDGQPPMVQGFLDGDVAEVLLYDRVLTGEERAALDAHLAKKHAGYEEQIAAEEGGHRLVAVERPPEVQVFVPGFTARRLPVELTNVNNVRYQEDGKLVALAYDGNVYVLSDTDGDGVEDKAEVFWDNQAGDGGAGRIVSPIGMALTPPGYRLGRGVFVAGKGKVSLLLDGDGDGKAEREVVVAEGWKPLPHQVDALGVAMGADGSIYFGLGTANFTNAYLTDPAGKARYSLKDERGTILKVSPDFAKREIVASGIRFPVGMAFNRFGDLFATDQEGATWLANGNPFDELLHIQQGRHYGFPPRHPKHLPDVVDEPSVFDYAPQHQSTCGLCFNEPVNGGPVFGPETWRGDAIVCGESRGKLYRTQLVKTEPGYVARNHLLASLPMLAVDACVSPKGELVVAAHSGNPDWGSGPKGKGALYKIKYAEKERPQPVAVWAAGPHEVRVAFDKALDASALREVAKGVTVEAGAYVAAGDRFEKLRPGYAVVQSQVGEARRKVEVTGLTVTPDGKTVVLSTGRQTQAVNYAVTLTGWGKSNAGAGEIEQVDAVDLAYDLSGVAAEWRAEGAERYETIWLPHLDLNIARVMTAGSAQHEAFWKSLNVPGKLTLRTSLDLWGMLRPAVQVGSTLDHTPPKEQVTVTFDSVLPMEVKFAGAERVEGAKGVSFRVSPKERELLPVEVTLSAAPEARVGAGLSVSFSTAEDGRARALPLRRFLQPWARVKKEAGELLVSRPPELEGGDWARGREVFFSDAAACSKCHQALGQGGDMGPDLANLIHRDYESVMRDIREPSGALNPDYIASVVKLKDRRVMAGILRSVGEDRFIVRGDAAGEERPLHRSEVAKVTASSVSVMPEGLLEGLSAGQVRDLMTFLLMEPLQPAPIERAGLPVARKRSEVEAVLGPVELRPTTRPAASEGGRKLNVLLVAGPKDHGPSEHDYPLWQKRWGTLLGLAEGVSVAQANGWPSAEQWAAADVAVFYSANPAWSGEKAKEVDAFLERGGGLVFIHFALNGQGAPEELAKRSGLAWRNGGSRFRHGPVDLTFRDTAHPVTRGFERLAGRVRFVDESYWNLVGDVGGVNVLAEGVEDGAPRPLVWTGEKGRGRVFACVLGHFTWTFDDPLYRVLVLRGMAWAAGEPADRLTPLATMGARIRP